MHAPYARRQSAAPQVTYHDSRILHHHLIHSPPAAHLPDKSVGVCPARPPTCHAHRGHTTRARPEPVANRHTVPHEHSLAPTRKMTASVRLLFLSSSAVILYSCARHPNVHRKQKWQCGPKGHEQASVMCWLLHATAVLEPLHEVLPPHPRPPATRTSWQHTGTPALPRSAGAVQRRLTLSTCATSAREPMSDSGTWVPLTREVRVSSCVAPKESALGQAIMCALWRYIPRRLAPRGAERGNAFRCRGCCTHRPVSYVPPGNRTERKAPLTHLLRCAVEPRRQHRSAVVRNAEPLQRLSHLRGGRRCDAKDTKGM